MSIQTEMNPKYISAADASANARNAKVAATVGNATTDRGTLIRRSNTEFDKTSFLKILSAQLSNQDPTQNQDSSAYVAQMAQFASVEQMANLNTTMSDSAYQQMLGKRVILNEKDDSGADVEGYVTRVEKKSGVNYLTVNINGKEEDIDVKNVIGAVQETDANITSNTIANSKAALNSDFLAASALAADKKSVVLGETDKDGNIAIINGKVTGAYIDAASSAKVKIKVDVVDSENKTTNKTYNYEDIIKAGDLTTDEITTTVTEAEAAVAKAAAEKAAAAAKVAEAKAAAEKIAAEKAAAEKAAAPKAQTSTATGA